MNRRRGVALRRLIVTFVICLGVCSAVLFGGAASASAAAGDGAKARAHLENAQWHYESKDYDNARKSILEALATAPDDNQIRDQARSLWQTVTITIQVQQSVEELSKILKEAEAAQKTKNQLAAQLDEAKRLSEQGKNKDASETALDVLKATNDAELVEKAKDILAENRPSMGGLLKILPQRLFVIGGWVLDILLAVLLVFIPLLLYRRARAFFKRYSWHRAHQDWKKDNSLYQSYFEYVRNPSRLYLRWVFQGVDDKTQMGVAEAVLDSFARMGQTKPAAYADLLHLERMKFQPLMLEFPTAQVDALPALESLNVQIGGVTLGGIATAFKSLRSWNDAKLLWIKGTAIAADEQITVSLTRRKPDDTTSTISATASKSKIKDLADTVTYMMYYSLTKEASISETDAANKLREGMILLDQYVSGQDPKQLEVAYKVFRSLRIEKPSFYKAYLYEGIALDLLEQHDEAIKRFQYLKDNSSESDLVEKAKYNEAVSLFRSYRPQAFEKSIEILDSLTGIAKDWYSKDGQALEDSLTALAGSPIKALAVATQANVVAHKPIFWKYSAPKGGDHDTPLEVKAAAKATVDQFVSEVLAVTEQLEKVLKRATGEKWDDISRQELKWAIENARGNVYLNYACNYLVPPHVEGANEPGLRLDYLKRAYEYFQECEMILPPGVETLTNLATALLGLCRDDNNYSYDKVRAYLYRAKEVNPHYEYADYRLAESWEQQGRIDEVVKILRAFAKEKTPTISSFRNLYSKYSLELAKFPVEPIEPSPDADAGSADSDTKRPEKPTA